MEATLVENLLVCIGFGNVQIQLIVIGALILLAGLNDTLGTSFLLPASQCDLNLSTQDKGFLSGMTFLGVTVSSYFWGFLGDTKGRRWVIVNALILSSLFSTLSVFIANFPAFVFCRFMVGVFVSGYSTTMYAYIGEFNTDKNRTVIISWITISIGLANIFIPASAFYILTFNWSFNLYPGYFFRPWRLLMIVYSLPGAIAAIWLLNFPESPRFLLMRNHHQKAADVIKWIHKVNKGDKDKSSFDSTQLALEIPNNNNNSVVNNENKGELFKALARQTLPLLKPPFLIYVSICSMLHFGTFAISNGVGVFIPDFLNKLSSSKNDSKLCVIMESGDDGNIDLNSGSKICNDDIDYQVYMNTGILGVLYTIAFILLAVVVKFVKRKFVLNFTLLVSCASGFALIFANNQFLILVSYFGFVIFAGINVSVINSAACDAIPTQFRSMAVCIAMLFGRLGSVLTSNFIGHFIETQCELVHYALASLVLFCFLLSFFLT